MKAFSNCAFLKVLNLHDKGTPLVLNAVFEMENMTEWSTGEWEYPCPFITICVPPAIEALVMPPDVSRVSGKFKPYSSGLTS